MMYSQQSSKEIVKCRPLHGYPRLNMPRWFLLGCLLAIILVYSLEPKPIFARGTIQAQEPILVTQEIRYIAPKAGEVFLVWGINGWGIVDENIRPPGTVIKDEVMHTPMMNEGGGVFIVKIRGPQSAIIDYGFLITKKQDGTPIKVWDDIQDYQVIAGQKEVIEIRSTISLTQAKGISTIFKVGVYSLIAMGILFALGLILIRIPKTDNRRAVRLMLFGLILLGLALRLWMAWDKNQHIPDPSAFDHLVGDEPGYEYLAYSLLQGSFFQWPGRTPVYPLFLAGIYLIFGHSYAAALYAQAVVATTSIPLTYLLARRFTGKRGSLLATALIALHPALIEHVVLLYTEAIYTPLLLLVALSLLWAFDAPQIHRFIIAGILLAVLTLCRPTTVLFPAVLLPLLPWRWSLRRRLILFSVYVAAMIAVIAPWTYHNYRTYHVFMPLSVSTAVLWQGSPEFYHLMEQKRTLLQIWDGPLNPDKNGGHDAFSIEGDRYFNARAIASIKAEPDIYGWYVLQKLLYFWIGHPANDWPNYAIFGLEDLLLYFPAWKIIGIYFTRLLPFVALFGLIILRHRLQPFLPLLAICGYLMVISALTYATVRYSETLHPILMIVIAASISELGRYSQHSQIFSGFVSRTASLSSLHKPILLRK